MKTGNKQQVVVLSIVAVGAIGFLAMQLKGVAANASPQAMAQQPAASDAKTTMSAADELPKTLFGDPFSHPALPRTLAENASVAAPQPSPIKGASKPAMVSGHLSVSPLQPPVEELPSRENDPETPRQQGPIICLQAVISSPHPVAFLSIDGKDPLKFTAGQTVFKNFLINSIFDGAIEVRLASGTRKLNVGETIQL